MSRSAILAFHLARLDLVDRKLHLRIRRRHVCIRHAYIRNLMLLGRGQNFQEKFHRSDARRSRQPRYCMTSIVLVPVH